MDPLSISMAILTLIGSVNSSVKLAKSFYNVSEEIDSLLNDLTEAEKMIRDIQTSLIDDKNSQGPQTELESSFGDRLKISELALLELQALVETDLKTSSSSSLATKRVVWLRILRKTKKLRKKLAEAHSELPRRLGQLQAHRIRIELNNVTGVQGRMQDSLERLESHATSTSRRLAQIREAQEDQSRIHADMTGALQILPRVLSLLERGHGIPHFSHPAVPKTTCLTYESFVIRGRYNANNSCQPLCHCKCHVKQRFISPSDTVPWLGQLFICYKALPGLRIPCTDNLCKRETNRAISISFFFPQWWVCQRVLMFRATYQALRGPEIMLSFPRIVPIGAPIFTYTSSGGIEGIKDLFSRGLASTKDIRVGEIGITPVQNAINYRNWPVVEFLIHQGADLETRNNTGRNALDYVWSLILSKGVPLEIANWLSILFPYPGGRELGFSNLHEAVLSVGSRSLREEIARLALGTETINDQDLRGRTPLSWAAGRDDLEATELLLQHGADPNIPDEYGMTPVTYSLITGQARCIHILVQCGAKLDTKDVNGSTSLQHLAKFINGPLYLPIAELLHSVHADLDAKDSVGFPVLFTAAVANNCESVRWLLAHHVDYKLYHHGNFLHYLGWAGSSEMFEIVREARLVGIDVHDLEPDESKTALEMLKHPARKTPATSEMIETFALLLNEIEERTTAGFSTEQQPLDRKLSHDVFAITEYEDDTEDESEIFQDAIEEQLS